MFSMPLSLRMEIGLPVDESMVSALAAANLPTAV
jgi:hypothetical protein